jgi:acetyl/propionyl-CoA carboxylase alpha subunit
VFKKILIANRGEIAVRILHTCRDMGIPTVALYERPDRYSLHVRLADECVLLDTKFTDQPAIIRLALDKGADAIHPGYGFLAENVDFIRACDAAGLAFIGPSASAAEAAIDKLSAIERARAAGFPTVEVSPKRLAEDDFAGLQASAAALGYPVILKGSRVGRGPGVRFVRDAARLEKAAQGARAESQATFGQRSIYVEKAIMPVHLVSVQILADKTGHTVHLGDWEGSLQFNNRKLVEESPSPCMSAHKRAELYEAALALARLFQCENAATIEFLIDGQGQHYFTELKPRIVTEHPLLEMQTGLDLVREQIRIAAGESLGFEQADVHLRGCAVLCRITAEDPLHRLLPSPGRLDDVRLPSGPGVRADTYVHPGCDVPGIYNSLIAKLTTWGEDRHIAISRMGRALREFAVVGAAINVPFIQQVLATPDFLQGGYDTETVRRDLANPAASETYYRDLAVIAALHYAFRHQTFRPTTPDRLQTAWHRTSRRLPE